MHRRSPIWLIVSILSLVTALTLLGLGALATDTPPWPVPAAEQGQKALVLGFYGAVNTAIQSGDTASLALLLAPDFVEHGGSSSHPPTVDGFVQDLAALRADFPTMRLIMEDLVAQDDLLVVRVRVEGAVSSAPLAISIAGQRSPWGTVDVFRISAGRIAEHWGGRERSTLLAALQELRVEVPASARQSLWLTHSTLAPGRHTESWTVLGPETTEVETGRLIATITSGPMGVRLSPSSDGLLEDVPVGTETILQPGDLLQLPAGVHAVVRNDEGIPATFRTVAIREPGGANSNAPFGAPVPASTPTSVITTAEAAGPMVTLPSGPATLRLSHLALPPGASLSLDPAATTTFVVETGTLDTATTTGRVWRRLATDGTVSTAAGIAGPGDAVMIDLGAAGELRNAGSTPVFVRVVTITPTT